MAIDYSALSLIELEARVRETGACLLAADEEGGDSEIPRWTEIIGSALVELLRRGQEGEATIVRLFHDSNLEVKLCAANAALQQNFAVLEAKVALQELLTTRGGNGWPAHFAQKVLAHYR